MFGTVDSPSSPVPVVFSSPEPVQIAAEDALS